MQVAGRSVKVAYIISGDHTVRWYEDIGEGTELLPPGECNLLFFPAIEFAEHDPTVGHRRPESFSFADDHRRSPKLQTRQSSMSQRSLELVESAAIDTHRRENRATGHAALTQLVLAMASDEARKLRRACCSR